MTDRTARPPNVEINELRVRVQAVRRIIEYDILFGTGSREKTGEMLAQADQWLERAA